MAMESLSTLHPGRILLEELLAPRGISVWHLARELGLSGRHLYEIVQGQRSITADMARRLAHYFGLSERFWLRLQAAHDLESRNARLGRYGKPESAVPPVFIGVEPDKPPARCGRRIEIKL